jgi:hypothetical protein
MKTRESGIAHASSRIRPFPLDTAYKLLAKMNPCHTRFYKENRMHLICAPGSFTHT